MYNFEVIAVFTFLCNCDTKKALIVYGISSDHFSHSETGDALCKTVNISGKI